MRTLVLAPWAVLTLLLAGPASAAGPPIQLEYQGAEEESSVPRSFTFDVIEPPGSVPFTSMTLTADFCGDVRFDERATEFTCDAVVPKIPVATTKRFTGTATVVGQHTDGESRASTTFSFTVRRGYPSVECGSMTVEGPKIRRRRVRVVKSTPGSCRSARDLARRCVQTGRLARPYRCNADTGIRAALAVINRTGPFWNILVTPLLEG